MTTDDLVRKRLFPHFFVTFAIKSFAVSKTFHNFVPKVTYNVFNLSEV